MHAESLQIAKSKRAPDTRMRTGTTGNRPPESRAPLQPEMCFHAAAHLALSFKDYLWNFYLLKGNIPLFKIQPLGLVGMKPNWLWK